MKKPDRIRQAYLAMAAILILIAAIIALLGATGVIAEEDNENTQENYQQQIENLQLQINDIPDNVNDLENCLIENFSILTSQVDNILGELDLLKLQIHENSDEWATAVENLQARYDGLIGQQQLIIDNLMGRIIYLETKGPDLPLNVIAGIVAIFIVCVLGLKMGWFKGIISSQRGVPTKVPMEDRVKRAVNLLKGQGIEVKTSLKKSASKPPEEPPSGEPPS